MQAFEFQLRTRAIFGPGALDRLGEIARELGFRRTLLVTDRGLVAAGHFDRASALLNRAGIEVAGFHDLPENPIRRPSKRDAPSPHLNRWIPSSVSAAGVRSIPPRGSISC